MIKHWSQSNHIFSGTQYNGTDNKLSFLNILGSNLQDFHEQDVKRVRDDDHWLSCFLKSRKQEVNDALPALVSCEDVWKCFHR